MQLEKMTQERDSISSSVDSLTNVIESKDKELTEKESILDSLIRHVTPKK
jgi:hypothetical protein